MSDPFSQNNEAKDEVFETDLPENEDDYRVPEGEYLGECTNLFSDVSEAGNKMWVWQFKTRHDKFGGREFRVYTALTPAAMWKVTEVVEALGLGQSGKRAKFKKEDAIGKMALLQIVDDEYKGVKRSNISRVLPVPEGMPIPEAKEESIPF